MQDKQKNRNISQLFLGGKKKKKKVVTQLSLHDHLAQLHWSLLVHTRAEYTSWPSPGEAPVPNPYPEAPPSLPVPTDKGRSLGTETSYRSWWNEMPLRTEGTKGD